MNYYEAIKENKVEMYDGIKDVQDMYMYIYMSRERTIYLCVVNIVNCYLTFASSCLLLTRIQTVFRNSHFFRASHVSPWT